MHIIYLGSSSFPLGLAAIERIKLISKALINEGHKVTVINNKGVHDRTKHHNIPTKGSFEDIDYIYANGSPYRPEGFLKRNILKIFKYLFELVALFKINQSNKISCAIISHRNSLPELCYYYFVSRILNFKIIENYVEYYSNQDRDRKGSFIRIINDRLFNKYAYLFCDGFIVISEFLRSHLSAISDKIKVIKVPVLVDSTYFNFVEKEAPSKYFLFCGSADYMEIIDFIINSYALLRNYDYKLYLVINGSKDKIKEVRKIVNEKGLAENIYFYSDLKKEELYKMYQNARALLIPMRNTLQDKARFPHKIGEYAASGSPIITSNYGEIQHYLCNRKNALIARQYDITLFAEEMMFVINDPRSAREIGLNARKLALQEFQYSKYGKNIEKFILSL